MRKQMKKLVLAKETLRNLDEGKLEKVVGASDGSDAFQCAQSQCVQCLSYPSCPTGATKYC
jgi:hypothetical protein